MIVKAEKSPNLKWASWRPRTASLKASRLKTGSKLMKSQPQLEFKGRKRPMSHLKQSGRKSSLLLGLFVLFKFSTDWMRATRNREGNLPQSIDSKVNLIKRYPHRHTQNNV